MMRARQVSLSVVLVATMMAATFQLFALGVLASSIIDDLEISRTMIGVIGALNTGIGALTAPLSGRLTDRIGARRAVSAVVLLSVVGLLLMGLAGGLGVLLVSAVVSGVAQGWSNPATNALIADTLAPGERGTITGIKQSGVTLAIVLAGAALPWLEGLGDWQSALVVFAVAFSALAGLGAVLMPRSDIGPAHTESAPPSTQLAPFVWRLAFFAFLMGTSGGAIGRFLALFSEEELGLSLRAAGAVVAVSGAVGMVARILAARAAEHRVAPSVLLTRLAIVGVGASVLLASSTTLGAWLIWPTAVLYAVGYTAWNAVINLAVINTVPQSQTGRATGMVMLGFFLGLTIGSPLTGWIVDTFDTYGPAWWGAAVLAASAAVVMRRPE